VDQAAPLLYYLIEDAKAFPLLSREKEVELFTIMRRAISPKERKEAREVLINSNIRLAFSIAMKYLATRAPLEDLVGAALEGLIKGIDRFDPGKGTKFSTFGMVWIKQSVARALIEKFYNTPFRIPVHIMGDAKRVRRARWGLRRKGKEPTALEIARKADMEPRKVGRLLEEERDGTFADVHSMETSEDAVVAPEVFISDNGHKSIEEVIDEEKMMREIFSYLEPREVEIITRRFMGETLAQIGASFHVSRERVRQIQRRAIQKVKAKFRGMYQ
jgi:RNA polymerase primary sigma factor